VTEKDFKKMILVNFIFASPAVKSLTELSLAPLFTLLKKEGKIPSGDAIAEEEYQDNQRGQASPEVLKTPLKGGDSKAKLPSRVSP
jgi:hypothetical protein